VYPTYDFAHGQSDAIEGITHSICTLEFEDHRPLYDWFIENLPVPSRPRQYEFARLNLGYTVLSKRFLTTLVREGRVSGWDDPRMPTLAGLRRRGVPPAAIRDFARHVRSCRARASQQDRGAPHGRAAAAQGGDRELPGGASGGARGGQQS
jgi:glutaminyl-tRNA synthetase